MKKVFDFFIFSFFSAAIAYGVWGLVFLFLQKTPYLVEPVDLKMNFYSIELKQLLFPKKREKVEKKEPLYDVKSFKLKAIYSEDKEGFIIIEDEGKSVYWDLGKEYKGYKLIAIGRDSALLKRDGKRFILKFSENEVNKKKDFIHTSGSNASSSEGAYKGPRMDKLQRGIVEFYARNLKKVWERIGLERVGEGYEVTRIDPTSIFYRMGLRKGDVIVEINGNRLNNDAKAWQLYKNRQQFRNFVVTIVRNGTRKVLKYDVE